MSAAEPFLICAMMAAGLSSDLDSLPSVRNFLEKPFQLKEAVLLMIEVFKYAR